MKKSMDPNFKQNVALKKRTAYKENEMLRHYRKEQMKAYMKAKRVAKLKAAIRTEPNSDIKQIYR